MTGPAWFSAVDSLPASMAAEVSAFLPRATLAGYQRFLDTMYHDTRGSEVRLRDAAAAATDDALRIFWPHSLRRKRSTIDSQKRICARLVGLPALKNQRACARLRLRGEAHAERLLVGAHSAAITWVELHRCVMD